MKLTAAGTKRIAFANWCMQFMMLVSRTICALQGYSHLETAPTVHEQHKACKPYVRVRMPVHIPVYHMCMFNHSLNLVTQFHAMQMLFHSDHMCLGVESERKERKEKAYLLRSIE